jgi:steroid 5-alpha reductase family enzyme
VWINFGGGASLLSSVLGRPCSSAADPGRRVLLVCFGAALFARLTVTLFVLLKRRFDWSEFGGVAVALFAYQVGFSLLAMCESSPLEAVDLLATGVFVFGSYLNTGSELQRRRFKQDPANQGKLHTGGLFRYARHINYFGDLLWVSAWAAVTRNPWAGLIPILLALGFVFGFIPALTRHLRGRYGEEFEAWRRRTKALIPFIY